MMPLPQTKHPILYITMPSSGKTYHFRPFVSAEEKILLMGLESSDRADIGRSVAQIISNCVLDPEFDVYKMTTFDFDYTFVKLRAASVDNLVEVKYTDPEDDEEYSIRIDLNDIEVSMADTEDNKISQDDISIVLKYPTVKQFQDITVENAEQAIGVDDLLIATCIDAVYDEESKYDDNTVEELVAWIEQLRPSTKSKLRYWVNQIPDVTYTAKYKRKDGSDGEVVLRGLEDFFMF